jgi:hypothetical protein
LSLDGRPASVVPLTLKPAGSGAAVAGGGGLGQGISTIESTCEIAGEASGAERDLQCRSIQGVKATLPIS